MFNDSVVTEDLFLISLHSALIIFLLLNSNEVIFMVLINFFVKAFPNALKSVSLEQWSPNYGPRAGSGRGALLKNICTHSKP